MTDTHIHISPPFCADALLSAATEVEVDHAFEQMFAELQSRVTAQNVLQWLFLSEVIGRVHSELLVSALRITYVNRNQLETEWYALREAVHAELGHRGVHADIRMTGLLDKGTSAPQRWLALHRDVHFLVDAEGDLDWSAVYDAVFELFQESGVELSWVDPDTTYEEDVRAFVQALDKRVAPYSRFQTMLMRAMEGSS